MPGGENINFIILSNKLIFAALKAMKDYPILNFKFFENEVDVDCI